MTKEILKISESSGLKKCSLGFGELQPYNVKSFHYFNVLFSRMKTFLLLLIPFIGLTVRSDDLEWNECITCVFVVTALKSYARDLPSTSVEKVCGLEDDFRKLLKPNLGGNRVISAKGNGLRICRGRIIQRQIHGPLQLYYRGSF